MFSFHLKGSLKPSDSFCNRNDIYFVCKARLSDVFIRERKECESEHLGGMREEQHQFLSLLGQLPARLSAEQAAWVLNCQPHDVPILVAARLLKPLGNPPPNGIKFFATSELLEQMKDRVWLVKVTTAINQHWHKQNARKKKCPSDRSQNGHSSPARKTMAADG